MATEKKSVTNIQCTSHIKRIIETNFAIFQHQTNDNKYDFILKKQNSVTYGRFIHFPNT